MCNSIFFETLNEKRGRLSSPMSYFRDKECVGRNQDNLLAEKTEWLLEAKPSNMKKEAHFHQSLGKQGKPVFGR